jgi:catechol 2,3-dioxygenase-like lactoylglutathione lyase family enzyme
VSPPRLSGRIHHLALRSGDPERSARFYEDVLGLREVQRSPAEGGVRAIWLELQGAVLMIERALRAGPSAGTGHVLALAVAELEPWEDHLRTAGVPVVDRTDHTLFVLDPDGHRVALSRYPLPVRQGEAVPGAHAGSRNPESPSGS